jgi:hypothetical protein
MIKTYIFIKKTRICPIHSGFFKKVPYLVDFLPPRFFKLYPYLPYTNYTKTGSADAVFKIIKPFLICCL